MLVARGLLGLAIDGFYRVCSDSNNFYIQRVNPDNHSMNAWLNIATFGYNTTTKTSSFLMNSVDILATLASKADAIDLTNLKTTAAKNISFKNSSGTTIMSLDDSLNVVTNGLLTKWRC